MLNTESPQEIKGSFCNKLEELFLKKMAAPNLQKIKVVSCRVLLKRLWRSRLQWENENTRACSITSTLSALLETASTLLGNGMIHNTELDSSILRNNAHFASYENFNFVCKIMPGLDLASTLHPPTCCFIATLHNLILT